MDKIKTHRKRNKKIRSRSVLNNLACENKHKLSCARFMDTKRAKIKWGQRQSYRKNNVLIIDCVLHEQTARA